MNTFDFKKAYKFGYDLNKIMPDKFDRKIVDEWVDDRRIISFKVNEGNFLITCTSVDEDSGELEYSFLRFFEINGITNCSVDFQSSSLMELVRKLTELLEERHTF